ncbi:MAG: hypothetical protein Q8941_12265, partial [Bacteroidota bacterium]|nr:hypothetical protein [Bacteroidota bacterium]
MRKIVFCLLATTLLITGCNSNKKDEAAGKKDNGSSVETKQERNKKIIMASMESFMKGDLDGTFKDVASNFVDKIDGTVPPVTNVDTLKSFMKMLEASIEGYKGENLRYYA